ncbi:MAG TPA: FtsX-like permease family protein [Actinomycetota bacterium]|nr:FtsX-like permease family protein [Actinomycetota bacterium]
MNGAGAMWALASKGLRAHKARLTLSVLAVVLGVAFIAGTLLLTDSLTAGITKLAPRRATATVRAASTLEGEARPVLAADLPERLRRLEGIRAAAGKVLGGVQLRPVIGSVRGPSLGLSWPEDASLSPLELVTGQPPGAGEAAVSAGFARSDHVGVGDEVEVATSQGTTELRVSGIVRVNGTDGAGPASLVVFDLATARRLLGVAGYSSVDVLAAPDAPPPGSLAGLAADQMEVVDPRRAVQDDSAGVSDFLGTVAGVLRGFGILALAVGSFLIFNTLSMLAALRAREFGLLRVVGVTPQQLGLLVVSEAAVVGAVASLVGVTVGVGAAAGLLAWLASKDLLPPGLTPRWATLAFAVVMGTAVAVAASLPGAFRAGRTPPLRTLQEGIVAPSRPLARAAVAVGGAALVLGGISTAHGGRVVAGTGLCLVALVVGLPVVVDGLGGPLRGIGRPLGITVRLGAENAARNQRRTAATVAALIVGLATVVAASTYAASWQAATSAALTGSVHADLIVRHGTAVGQESTFTPKVAADLRRLDGVRQVVEVRTGRARVQGAETAIDAVDPDAVGQVLRLRLRTGSLAGLRHGTVLVSAGQARRHAFKAGDTVTIELPRTGPAPYRIAGVYDDTSLLAGYLLDLGTYAAGYARQRTTAAYLLTEPGVGLSDQGPLPRGDATGSVSRVLRRYQNLGVSTVGDYVASLREEAAFRSTLLQGLVWFVTLIALLGVSNTQALSVIERTREIGLLRAIGMRPRQVARMLRAETMVVGLLGTTLGLLVGLAAAWLAIRELSGFPDAGLVISASGLLSTALVAVVASVLAARAPARHATRINVLRAIATE